MFKPVLDILTLFMVAVILTVTFGCSLLQYKELPDLKETDIYRHDLVVDINGVRINGVGIAPRLGRNNVTVYPPGKVDRIMWRTCSQEQVIDKPTVSKIDNGWFAKDTPYVNFTFDTSYGLDDVNSCGLKIEVLEEKKRRNGFALVEFPDAREEFALITDLNCNGEFSQRAGVNICQSAAGLFQKIVFNVPVLQLGKPAHELCDVMKPYKNDETTYVFKMPAEECVYNFVSDQLAPNGKRMIFRLTTIGYTDVPPMK